MLTRHSNQVMLKNEFVYRITTQIVTVFVYNKKYMGFWMDYSHKGRSTMITNINPMYAHHIEIDVSHNLNLMKRIIFDKMKKVQQYHLMQEKNFLMI